MRLALQLNHDPIDTELGNRAWQCAQTALTEGHELVRIFFYHHAVSYAFSHDPNHTAFRPNWSELARAHDLDLVVCVSAALRRGWLNEAQLSPAHLLPGFRVAGLGLWAEAVVLADRVKVF
ncbi:MAG: DsrE family protein [Methylococcales bacterium]|nr:DsrE family protein [Methylococcales bacterium]